jgi:hypothetical protein
MKAVASGVLLAVPVDPCRKTASLQQRNETTHYLPSLSYFSFFSQKRKVAKEKVDFLPKAPPAKK